MGAHGRGKGRERNEEVSGIGTRETVCGRNRIRGAVGGGCRGGGSATQKEQLVRTGKTRVWACHPRSGQTRIAGKTTFSSQRGAPLKCFILVFVINFHTNEVWNMSLLPINRKSVNIWFSSSGDLRGGDLRGVAPPPNKGASQFINLMLSVLSWHVCGPNHQDSDPVSTTKMWLKRILFDTISPGCQSETGRRRRRNGENNTTLEEINCNCVPVLLSSLPAPDP